MVSFLLLRGHLVWDIFGCPSWEGFTTAVYWVEDSNAAEHPTVHKTAPCNKESSSPKISVVPKLRNPVLRGVTCHMPSLITETLMRENPPDTLELSLTASIIFYMSGLSWIFSPAEFSDHSSLSHPLPSTSWETPK